MTAKVSDSFPLHPHFVDYFYINFCHFLFSLVPRKVLLESFDVPIELDEQNQQESDYDNELDEDDGHYKEAIPPAPKLQGNIPRASANATQTISAKKQATSGNNDSDSAIKSDSMENQRSFSEGWYLRFSSVISMMRLF